MADSRTSPQMKSLAGFQQQISQLRSQQRWQELAMLCREAIQCYPKTAGFYHWLGNALLRLQRWEEAATAYQNVIALKNDFVWSYFYLGVARSRLKQWDAATQAYRKALAVAPYHMESAKKLVNFFPDRIEFYLILAQAFAKNHDWEQALVVCRMGLNLQPNHQQALQLENQLLKMLTPR